MYDAERWYRMFVLTLTGFAFWFTLWSGIWSVGFLIDLVKKSLNGTI